MIEFSHCVIPRMSSFEDSSAAEFSSWTTWPSTYGLGAQRRAIEKNDLPQVMSGLKEYLNMDMRDRQDLISSCAPCPSIAGALLGQHRFDRIFTQYTLALVEK